MSSWGITNFENDVALNLVDELINGKKHLSVQEYIEKFDATFNADDTTLDECMEYVTIAEITAAIAGSPSEDVPIDLKSWTEIAYIQVESKVLLGCASFVEKIYKDSELREMYADGPYFKAWDEVMKDLIKRLKS